jgi:hypothetical protein
MDAKGKELLDHVVEDEVRRGWKIYELDADLVALLRGEHEVDPTIPVLRRIRYTKLTPRKKREIADAAHRRYNKDLKDEELLSTDQIRRFNVARGEWSDDQERRMTELENETQAMMRELYLDGFDKRSEWLDELTDLYNQYREALEAKDESGADVVALTHRLTVQRVFDRWFAYTKELQDVYTEQFAKDQNLPEYNPDRDLALLLDGAVSTPEAADILNQIEDMRDRVQRANELWAKRVELRDLTNKYEAMFANSIESRRTNAIQMAQLYFCAEQVDDRDLPQGRLTRTFDELYFLPDEVIQVLLIELHFFLQGLPDTAREYLQTWGFLKAPKRTSSPEVSDASLVEPSSSADTTPSEAMAANSSESPAPTS